MPYYGHQFSIPFFITGSASHLTGGAGITWTRSDGWISKDGAAFSMVTNTPTALQSGWYKITITSAEASAEFLGVSLVPSGTACDPQNLLIRLDPSPTSFYAWPQSYYQAASFNTLAGAIGALTNQIQITSGGAKVEVLKADGTTVWGTFTVTQSAGFNPITKLTPA